MDNIIHTDKRDHMNRCIKCIVGMVHPWHDNGTRNEKCAIEQFMSIDWFDEEREDRERIQDARV